LDSSDLNTFLGGFPMPKFPERWLIPAKEIKTAFEGNTY
jgi:hypothetical protein